MSTTAAPLVEVEWEALLAEVDRASVELRRSATVPREVEQLIDGLDGALHAAAPMQLDADPYLATALFAAAYRAERALRSSDEAERRRTLRVALEQVRHALRDIVAERPFDEGQPVRDVILRVVGALAAPQRDLAELFGVSARQLQRWLAEVASMPTGSDEARIRIVARLVNQLQYTFTAPGVLAWFSRVHPELGVAPATWLDDPLSFPVLLRAARAARAMGG